MLTSLKVLAVASAIAVFATPAWTQGPGMGPGMGQGPRGGGPGTGPVVANCQPEIEKFCEGLEHGGRAIRMCLEKNKAQVSAACKSALDTTGPGRRWQ